MNSIFDQLGKIWNDLTAGQRLTIVVALLAVVAGMGALMYWSSKPQMKMLYGGIDAKEMSAVVASLEEEKIPYEISSGGRSIFVPSEKVYNVRMKMASQGIPNGGGVGYEIFDKGNFGISDFVQRTNYVRALQGELARSIGELQGVRSARVMIVLPENKLLVTNDHARPTASVFVDVGGASLREENVNAIRYLVANSVEGLKVNDVAVIDSMGKVLSSEVSEDESLGAATGHFKLRKSLEDYFTQKINSLLLPVVGSGNVVVRVSVDLNYDAQTMVEEKYDPEGQVIRNQSIQEDSSSASETSAGGSVGVASNTPNGGGTQGSTGGSSNSNTKKNRTIAYEINKSVSETVRNPGTIKSISASVLLAKKIEKGATAAAPINRTPQELDIIRKMVSNALGIEASPTALAKISVEEMMFDKPEAAPASTGLAAVTANAGEWMDMGRKFLAIGAAIAIFIIFLGMLKKQKAEPVNFEVIEEKPSASREAPMTLTPEILNELIQQKPENVSAALKGWVNGGQQNNR